MAIDTNNKKFSLITYQQMWNTPIPSTAVAFTTGDKEHLIAQYSGISWGAPPAITATHNRGLLLGVYKTGQL